MLSFNLLSGIGASGAADIFTANLQIHLDIADAASYDGSSQTWSDLTGNGFHFYRGATSGSDASDPTYNAGPPAYFSADGGDFFLMTAAHSGLFPRKIFRSDQAFSLEAWVYRGATANTDEALCGNNGSSGTSAGGAWLLDYASNKPAVYAQGSERGPGTAQIGVGAWKQVFLTGKHDGSTCTHYVNGASNGTYTYTEASFTSGDSNAVLRIGEAFGGTGATVPFQSGTRIAIFRAYDAILTAGQVLQNFDAQKSRFGL